MEAELDQKRMVHEHASQQEARANALQAELDVVSAEGEEMRAELEAVRAAVPCGKHACVPHPMHAFTSSLPRAGRCERSSRR